MPSHALDYPDAGFDWRAEVLCSLDLVALVEVVGTHFYPEKPLAQPGLLFHRVVDSAKKNGLVVHRHPGPEEPVAGQC